MFLKKEIYLFNSFSWVVCQVYMKSENKEVLSLTSIWFSTKHFQKQNKQEFS